MVQRRVLHEQLVTALGSDRVYFQPPPNFQMEYPCIRYEWTSETPFRSDNGLHFRSRGYTVMHISNNPDDPVTHDLSALPYTRFDRRYVAEQLTHTVYTISL